MRHRIDTHASRLPLAAFAALAAVVFATSACSSDESPSPTGSSGSGGDAGSSSDAAADADTGAADIVVNACKQFDDRTAAGASRTIAWQFPLPAADRCIAVRAGQSVTWTGDFTKYRLVASGGDKPSPISAFDPSSPSVTFPKAGTYGFGSPDAPALVGAVQVRE